MPTCQSEMGCPSFCHLEWGSGEPLSGQKSRTNCPRAAWAYGGLRARQSTLGSRGTENIRPKIDHLFISGVLTESLVPHHEYQR